MRSVAGHGGSPRAEEAGEQAAADLCSSPSLVILPSAWGSTHLTVILINKYIIFRAGYGNVVRVTGGSARENGLIRTSKIGVEILPPLFGGGGPV